jgi:hypothetical protein
MKCNGYAVSHFVLKFDVPSFVYTAFSLRAVLVKTGKQWPAAKAWREFPSAQMVHKIPSFYLYEVEITFLFQEIGTLK